MEDKKIDLFFYQDKSCHSNEKEMKLRETEHWGGMRREAGSSLKGSQGLGGCGLGKRGAWGGSAGCLRCHGDVLIPSGNSRPA